MSDVRLPSMPEEYPKNPCVRNLYGFCKSISGYCGYLQGFEAVVGFALFIETFETYLEGLFYGVGVYNLFA